MPHISETKKMILATLFTALTAISAFIRIPLPFVPIVLQGLFVFLSGILLGSKWGAASQTAYLILGLTGLPIFTSGGGIGYIVHPTFGYLLGYIGASYIAGIITEKSQKRDFKTCLIAGIAGIFIIYIIGVPYLAVILKLTTHIDNVITYALWTGLLVTLPGDIIKAVLAALIAQRIPSSLL